MGLEELEPGKSLVISYRTAVDALRVGDVSFYRKYRIRFSPGLIETKDGAALLVSTRYLLNKGEPFISKSVYFDPVQNFYFVSDVPVGEAAHGEIVQDIEVPNSVYIT